MRSQTSVIILCGLAGTLGLCAVMVLQKPAAPARVGAAPAVEQSTNPAPPAVTSQAPGTQIQTRETFRWNEVESNDYKEYISNLRRIQCPEEVIRDIILADINALFAPREAPLRLARAAAQNSIRNSADLEAGQLETDTQWRQLQLEKRDLVKQLLGITLPLDLVRSTSWRNYDDYAAALNQVPEEKRDQVQLLKETYWRASDALKAKYGGKRPPEFVEEYKLLNGQHMTQLAQILTPAELEDFQMRSSLTGSSLSQRMGDFNATEEEFRTLYRLTHQYEESTGRVGGMSSVNAVEAETRQAARRQLEEQLKGALGEERYAAMERAQDNNHRNLSLVAERYSLPAETVQQTLDLEKKMRQENETLLNAMRGLNRGDQEAQVQREALSRKLQMLNETHRKAINDLLGPKAGRAYRRALQGN